MPHEEERQGCLFICLSYYIASAQTLCRFPTLLSGRREKFHSPVAFNPTAHKAWFLINLHSSLSLIPCVACMPAAYLALEDVNSKKDLLPDFQLTLHSNDSEVGRASKINLFYFPKIVRAFGLVGRSCNSANSRRHRQRLPRLNLNENQSRKHAALAHTLHVRGDGEAERQTQINISSRKSLSLMSCHDIYQNLY